MNVSEMVTCFFNTCKMLKIIATNISLMARLKPCLHVAFFSPFLLAVPLIFLTYFNVMCKHLHWILWNPFFNGLNNGLKNATCKRTLTVKVHPGSPWKLDFFNVMFFVFFSAGPSDQFLWRLRRSRWSRWS